MRAKVWKSGPTWYYQVYGQGKVLAADNTNNWRKILDQADECVRAFARVERVGHKFKHSWSELVDRA